MSEEANEKRSSLLGELLASVDVRVLGPLERPLELLELLGGERGARASLFPLESDPRLGIDVRQIPVRRRSGVWRGEAQRKKSN